MKDMIDSFELNTEDHELQVIVEKDNHRIMKFAKRGTNCFSVTVMQTRGKICFTGDMGEFVFVNHNADMLAWFRDNTSLAYIAEKCRAGNYSEYSEVMAKESIEMRVNDFCTDYMCEYLDLKYPELDINELSVSELGSKQGSWEVVLNNQSKRNINFENEYTFYQSVSELEIELNLSSNFTIDISDGLPCKDYTDRFKWCVLAMNKIAFLYFNKKVSMK